MQLIDSSANGRKFPLGMESALMNKTRPKSVEWMDAPALHVGVGENGYLECLLYTDNLGESRTNIFPPRDKRDGGLLRLPIWMVVI